MTGARPDRPRRVVWSGVRSQAHVAYGASYLRALLASTSGPVRLVELGRGSFLGTTAVTDADLDRLLPDDPRLVRSPGYPEAADGGRPGRRHRGDLRASGDEELTYLAVGAPGIKPWLRIAAANPGRRFAVVVTDEGIGSYGTWRSRRDAWRREGGREPWPTIRALAVWAARASLTTQRWPLYQRDGASWRLNEAVAGEFRRTAGSPPASGHAVFLSQPWVELGVLQGTRYEQHVRRVGEACARAGLAFVVRPHPAEDVRRYDGMTVWGGASPAEMDGRIAGAAVVLGATSTALLNLAAIHRRPAVRVVCPGGEAIERDLSARQRGLLRQYVGPCVPESAVAEALGSLRR